MTALGKPQLLVSGVIKILLTFPTQYPKCLLSADFFKNLSTLPVSNLFPYVIFYSNVYFCSFQIQMSDILNAVKNFFQYFRGVEAGEYDAGDRRFYLEDFDRQLTDKGIDLKDIGSTKRVSIMDISSAR